jgi:hypothetical protein
MRVIRDKCGVRRDIHGNSDFRVTSEGQRVLESLGHQPTLCRLRVRSNGCRGFLLSDAELGLKICENAGYFTPRRHDHVSL